MTSHAINDGPIKGRKQRELREDVAIELDALRFELARSRVVCRAWSETLDVNKQRDQAGAFACKALDAFAQKAVPPFRRSSFFAKRPGPLDDTATLLAEKIGSDAAALGLVEGLYFITSLYPALLPTRDRGRLGAFYTPPALAARLLDLATEASGDWQKMRVLDPAAGGGAFLVEAARRMRTALADCDPAFVLAQIGARLLGLELDAQAANLAQGALEILLADLSASCGRAAPIVVRICDTLDEPPNEAFDLVVGNPPYGRVTLTPEQRERYGRSLYGHANLYGIFTDAALRWTKPSGIIAYLTPTSFLAGQYYGALRGLLAKEAPPIAIDFVHARHGVFEDVLQETLLAIYQKGGVRRAAQVHYLHISNERDAKVTRNGTIRIPVDATTPWLAPRNASQAELIERVAGMATRLSDLGYSVSTGPLVWNRFKGQLRNKPEGTGVHPLIWAEAVTSDGRFLFRAQKKNHAPFFKVRAADAWLVVKQPCVLVQRTTAKEQARRLIAAELPKRFVEKHGGVVIENHLNMVRAGTRAKIPTAVVAALFNSRVVDQLFRCMNGSVAVSAFELEALPLPHPRHLKRLTQLVARGADRTLIEAECERLYGEVN